MTPRMRLGAGWVIVTTLLPTVSSTRAETGFKLLNEREIRVRVVGNDITDGPHWSMYLRPDGALISSESGSSRTGRWKIGSDRLCLAHQSGESLTCNEVWVSGSNIRLRENKDQETFDAVIMKHQTN
jgi:hypothetical protein